MNKTFKEWFSKPSAQEQVVDSLEQSKQMLLMHEHQANYHTHMVKFYRDSIKRLTEYETNGDVV